MKFFHLILLSALILYALASSCASSNQECGLAKENRQECCSGYQCVTSSLTIGAPGVCKPISEGQCSQQSESCDSNSCCYPNKCNSRRSFGHSCQYLGGVCSGTGEQCRQDIQDCCADHDCVHDLTKTADTPGVCKLKSQCSAKNEECSNRACCDGYECHAGYCEPKTDDTQCGKTSDLCDSKKCCDGYQCRQGRTFNYCWPTIGLASPYGFCADINESCGLPAEGHKECCIGFKCQFDANIMGGAGICRLDNQVHLSKAK